MMVLDVPLWLLLLGAFVAGIAVAAAVVAAARWKRNA
jgi:uncharacterized membrane protein YidH (DUF202 family)